MIFADYTCHTLCGPILDFAVAGLAKTGLQPGLNYRLLVIGLDPKDGLDAARAMRMPHTSKPTDAIAAAAVFLTGSDCRRSALRLRRSVTVTPTTPSTISSRIRPRLMSRCARPRRTCCCPVSD